MSVSAESSDFSELVPTVLAGSRRLPPLPIVLAAAGATSIVAGLLWDISWHRSIGRDTFWTPAHMAIYLGGLLAALASVPLVLRSTRASATAPAAGIGIGPLRAPLGVWVMIWGAAAMLASAPFDDWWHNAYGLDVRVISPPHAVLAAGMVAVVAGAMLLTLSFQNGVEAVRLPGSGALYAWASGILVTLAATYIVEYTFPLHQHGWLFYAITGAVFPLFLVAGARASRGRHPAVLAAGIYMGIVALFDWILPLFPAEPRLGPIYNPITRMVPFCFPLLIVFPAAAIDELVSRRREGRDGRLAILLGFSFLGVFLLVQFPFGSFQMTPASRNWFFLGDRYWSYWFQPESSWRYAFGDARFDRLTVKGLLIAGALAVVSSRAGLYAGAWMRRVRR
jgi:hypothetical protein